MVRRLPKQVKVPQPTTLRGVTNRNADKQSRQELLALCRSGQRLAFAHDAKRPITWALDADGNRLGYFTAERSEQIRALQSQGLTVVVTVLQVTGQSHDSLGLNVEIDITRTDRNRLQNRRMFKRFLGCVINIVVFVGLMGIGVHIATRLAGAGP